MPNRAKLIQLVHIGAAKLFGGDEDARRDWQFAVSGRGGRPGQRSCSDMSNDQLEDLVAELRAKGALDKRSPRRAGRKPFSRSQYLAKVAAQLADMGLPWSYAESIAWRLSGGKGLQPGSQPGVKRLDWLKGERHWRNLVAALDYEQKKRSYMASITDMLKNLGEDLAYVDTLVPANKRGSKWQRDLKWLKAIDGQLAEKVHEAKAAAVELSQC